MTATGPSLGTLALLTLLLATDNARAQSFQGYGSLSGGSYSNQFGSGRLSTIAGGADMPIARGFDMEGEVGLVGPNPTPSLDGVFQTYNGPNIGVGVNLWAAPARRPSR